MYFVQTKFLFTPFSAGENHRVLEANLTLNQYHILLFSNLLWQLFCFSMRDLFNYRRSLSSGVQMEMISHRNRLNTDNYTSLRQMASWISRSRCGRMCDGANPDEFQFCPDKGVWISMSSHADRTNQTPRHLIPDISETGNQDGWPSTIIAYFSPSWWCTVNV